MKDKNTILLIESSSRWCSIGLWQIAEEQLIFEQNKTPLAHAEWLASAVDNLLTAQNISTSKLAGIAVSSGPGSYTGLRIGVAFAKGISFAMDIPFYPVNTLYYLQDMAEELHPESKQIFTAIDAGRNEVYGCISVNGIRVVDNQPLILDEFNLAELGSNKDWLIAGNATEKINKQYASVLDLKLMPLNPSVEYMQPALQKLNTNYPAVELAYFEPNYIKPFIAGVSKKFAL